MTAARQGGGKSGLHRTKRWVTPSPGDGKDSATERKPPLIRTFRGPIRGKGEKVR
jgi:hypothetical protein